MGLLTLIIWGWQIMVLQGRGCLEISVPLKDLGHVDMTNQKLHALDIKTKLASLRTAIC